LAKTACFSKNNAFLHKIFEQIDRYPEELQKDYFFQELKVSENVIQ